MGRYVASADIHERRRPSRGQGRAVGCRARPRPSEPAKDPARQRRPPACADGVWCARPSACWPGLGRTRVDPTAGRALSTCRVRSGRSSPILRLLCLGLRAWTERHRGAEFDCAARECRQSSGRERSRPGQPAPNAGVAVGWFRWPGDACATTAGSSGRAGICVDRDFTWPPDARAAAARGEVGSGLPA
jgi:hypothetical protein